MQRARGRFKEYVMRFSYQARRKRKLENFKHEVKYFREMNEDELNFEYIELKTELDHKKNVLSLFVISIALAILMNAWSHFFSFMQKVLQYAAASTDNSEEIMKISFGISIIIVVFITVAILFLLFDLSKDMMIIQKKLMIIENIKEEKQ